MHIEIKEAKLPDELHILLDSDRAIFGNDAWGEEEWLVAWKKKGLTCFWFFVKEVRAGFVVFLHNNWGNPKPWFYVRWRKKCVFIPKTGLFHNFQNRRLGNILKAFEITYAMEYNCTHIRTIVRRSNGTMIKINEKYGFKVVNKIPNYYQDPVETGRMFEYVF